VSPNTRKSEREQLRQRIFLALSKEDLKVYQIVERFDICRSTATHYIREYKKGVLKTSPQTT
jgi:transposase